MTKPNLSPTGRDLDVDEGDEYESRDDTFHPDDRELTDEEYESEQLEKQRASRIDPPKPEKPKKEKASKAKTPKNELPFGPPAAQGDAIDQSPPHAPPGSTESLETEITRQFPPVGWKGAWTQKDNGHAAWFESHDVREIQDFVERTFGGGKYKLTFYKNKRPTGTMDLPIAGDPLPLREEPEDDGFERSWAPPGGFRSPHQGGGFVPPGAGFDPRQPHTTYDPYGSRGPWTPPVTRTEQDLEAKLEEANQKLQEIADREKENKVLSYVQRLEAKLEALTAAKAQPAVNPMDTYLQIMQRQADADRARMEREDAERRSKAEREEKERKDRLDAEERRYQREREERREREEKEDKRRDEERKERLAREERQAQEQREFMKASAAANNPEKLITMLATLQGLTKSEKDPVDQIIRLTEAQQAMGLGPKDDDDDKEESLSSKVVQGIAGLAEGAGKLMEARANQQQPVVNAGTFQAQAALPPQQLPPPQPQPPRPPASEATKEQQKARLLLVLKTAIQQHRANNAPRDAAIAIVSTAQTFEAQGAKGAVAEVAQLAQFSELDAAEIQASLTMLKATLSNQAHAANLEQLIELLNKPEGVAWFRETLTAVGEFLGVKRGGEE